MSDEIYTCETCGKEYKTRAGLWKHQKKYKHGKFAETESVSETEPTPEPVPEESEAETVPISQSPVDDDTEASTSDTSSAPTDEDQPSVSEESAGDTPTPSWMNFEFTSTADDATDAIPTHFKMAVAGGSKTQLN